MAAILAHDVDPELVDGYLARLGFGERPEPTPEALAALQVAHLHRVPFENLDLHVGRRITIDVDRFVRKVVVDGRGGFCYELNGSVAWLLASLGWDVHPLEARVHGPGGPTQPFDHLCLRVGGAEPRLVDVGFGDCFDMPLPLRAGEVHHDTNGDFALAVVDDEWTDLVRGDRPAYRFSSRAHALDDFAPGCEFHQTPASHFMGSTVCSRRTDRGRVTLSGLTLITTVDGTRTESPVEPDDLGPLLAGEFGVVLAPADLERLRAASTPLSP